MARWTHAALRGVLAVVMVYGVSVDAGGSYKEELVVRPTPDGRAAVTLLATYELPRNPETGGVEAIFEPPRELVEVLSSSGVLELQVSLRKGKWEQDVWPAEVFPTPHGGSVSLWVSDEHGSGSTMDKLERVTQTLSGLLCASFDLITRSHVNTASPATEAFFGARNRDIVDEAATSKLRDGVSFAKGSLPREAICTENLTPWRKMLPCRGHTGLPALVNPLAMFKSRYHSIGLDVWQGCSPQSSSAEMCEQTALFVQHSLSVVLDSAAVAKYGIGQPPPRLWPSSFQLPLRKLLGNHLEAVCPAAQSTTVFIALTPSEAQDPAAHLSRTPSRLAQIDNSGNAASVFAVYELDAEAVNRSSPFTVTFSRDDAAPAAALGEVCQANGETTGMRQYLEPVLQARRFLTGSGLLNRGVTTTVANTGSESLDIAIVEVLPWFLSVKHSRSTVAVHNEDSAGTPYLVSQSPHVVGRHYKPGLARQEPTVIETWLRLDGHSEVHLRHAMDIAFMGVEELPADPNHGLELPSASVWASIPAGRDHNMRSAALGGVQCASAQRDADAWASGCPQHLRRHAQSISVVHTEILLVDVPLPDFSMPYNVITLSSSVMAFIIGSAVNVLGRKRRNPNGRKKPSAIRRMLACGRGQPSNEKA